MPVEPVLKLTLPGPIRSRYSTLNQCIGESGLVVQNILASSTDIRARSCLNRSSRTTVTSSTYAPATVRPRRVFSAWESDAPNTQTFAAHNHRERLACAVDHPRRRAFAEKLLVLHDVDDVASERVTGTADHDEVAELFGGSPGT